MNTGIFNYTSQEFWTDKKDICTTTQTRWCNAIRTDSLFCMSEMQISTPSYNIVDTTTNSSMIECPVCADEYPVSQMERMFLCDHMICLPCLKDYYRLVIKEIRDFKSLKRLICLWEEHEISEDMTWDFLQYLETKVSYNRSTQKIWFGNYLVQSMVCQWKGYSWHVSRKMFILQYKIHTIKNVLIQEYVHLLLLFYYCYIVILFQCLGFFYASDDNRIASVECPHCQFEQCQQCWRKVSWKHVLIRLKSFFNSGIMKHTDMDCKEYAQWLEENDPNDPEVQLVKYLNTVSTIICPNQSCKAVYVQ